MLYHYTDRLSCADIRREGVIRAAPLRLHRDLLARDEGEPTPTPIVWLTSNPVIDGTVLAKMVGAGWPPSLIGDLCRIAVRADYPALALGEYCDHHRMDARLWDCVVRTGALVGSDYTTWRLAETDIPAGDWLSVEALAGIGSDGMTRWRPMPDTDRPA
jgi:hypothetical protein